jgi:hypothetical protein
MSQDELIIAMREKIAEQFVEWNRKTDLGIKAKTNVDNIFTMVALSDVISYLDSDEYDDAKTGILRIMNV